MIRTSGLVVAAALILGVGSASAQQVVDYKGRRIQVAAGDQSAECLALVRKAIDMTSELPPKQKALAAEVKDLRCLPIPEGKATNEVRDNTVGVYTMVSPDDPSGYIRFPMKPGSLSAADVAMSLMGNGGYARWHHAYLAAKQKADTATAARYLGILKVTDKNARLKAECELYENDRAAIKALDLGERRMAAIGRKMDLRGCS